MVMAITEKTPILLPAWLAASDSTRQKMGYATKNKL